MALPSSYLTSTKNLEGILNSISGAQAPEKFTTRFLESLDYKTSSDRLVIGVLKSLGFLADDGRPSQRYFDYLDQSQSGRVLAQAVREAYADLFQVNKNANGMSRADVLNKFKTLGQGQYSESVLDKMASTFVALAALADWDATPTNQDSPAESASPAESTHDTAVSDAPGPQSGGMSIGGLVYNIQLILPESRDPKVYDVLFESLRRHLS
jgi:hypothetical protein